MGEIDSGMTPEVEFKGVPVVLVVAYFLAVRADRDQIFQTGEVAYIFQHQQCYCAIIIGKRTNRNERLQVFRSLTPSNLQINAPAIACVTTQTPSDGVANQAVGACRTSTTSLRDVGGMETMKHIASSPSIDRILGMAAEANCSRIQIQNFCVSTHDKQRDGDCIEDRPIQHVELYRLELKGGYTPRFAR